ncbi:MAG TPA: sodium:proton antiporter [Balneolales bacterium]|nr:sodium:proton antiporter [Balneolales bacterium]
MTENLLLGLVLIIFLGIASQWIAWRFKIPAILLLLLAGIAAGPVTGIINPDHLFGDLLFPIISLSVAVILFEGGLSLRFSELKNIGDVVRNLITVGVIVTWVLGSVGAYYFLHFDISLSVLLGAIFIVTGPTVIIPLLRQVRPSGEVGSVLKWEGIVNDPIGAGIAVLVFEMILVGGFRSGIGVAALGAFKTLFFGGAIGIIGALILYFMLKKHLIPDFLHNPISLMMVVSIFEASNLFQQESGLFAVTVMGVALANQRDVHVKHIIEFKENLRVILISLLFIILASRLTVQDIQHISWGSIGFLVFLILIVRPATVYLSTIGSTLNWRERLFLVGMAPRGIVAAAVSSLFSFQLVAQGHAEAEFMIPYTFVVIIGTVAIYGLTASPLARLLGVAKPIPRGFLILGAHEWSQKIGLELQKQGVKVLLADTNWKNISDARLNGLQTYYGNVLDEFALDEMNLDGIGHFLAMTSNDEVNSLSVLRFVEIFGRSQVFQLSPASERPNKNRDITGHLSGRILFDKRLTYVNLTELFEKGATLKTTNLTKEYNYDTFRSSQDGLTIPLFVVNTTGEIKVFALDNPPEPTTGQKIISLSIPENLSVELAEDHEDQAKLKK